MSYYCVIFAPVMLGRSSSVTLFSFTLIINDRSTNYDKDLICRRNATSQTKMYSFYFEAVNILNMMGVQSVCFVDALF